MSMKKQEKRIREIARFIQSSWGITFKQCLEEARRTDLYSKLAKIRA